jgi:hypothetical protein
MPQISLESIKMDLGTQVRVKYDEEELQELEARYREGKPVPDVDVFQDGDVRILADGFHRCVSAKKAGKDKINATVHKGTFEEALLFTLAANLEHGQKLTPADKENKVRIALGQKEWQERSNKWLAEACHVSEHLVKRIRDEAQAANGNADQPRMTMGRDGKMRLQQKAAPILCSKCQRLGAQKNCPYCRDARAEARKLARQQAEAIYVGTENARQHRARDVDNLPIPDSKKTSAEEPKDAFGNLLPKRCRDAYGDPWLEDSYNFLTGMQEKFLDSNVAKGMAKREKRYPFFKAKDVLNGCAYIQQYLDQLIDHFKTQRPAGVCPSCDGKKCGFCKMSGLLPRGLYLKLKETAQ